MVELSGGAVGLDAGGVAVGVDVRGEQATSKTNSRSQVRRLIAFPLPRPIIAHCPAKHHPATRGLTGGRAARREPGRAGLR